MATSGAALHLCRLTPDFAALNPGYACWVAGMGLGGQRVVIVPDLDLIVMTTSGAYASPRQGNAALEFLYKFVMPAVRVQ